MVSKKKRAHPDIEEVLGRPWCYYCERDFDDLKILISHQKAKHFKCERCNRRLNTAGGLSVHMNQVHKETLTSVENSLGNRASLDVEIFGMEGIPEDVVQAHNQRIIAQFYQAEAERRAATGNPGPGSGAVGGASKKPKFESPSELKKRLAEHKARLAEQVAGGGSSGDNTPLEGRNDNPMGQSPGVFNGSPYAPPTAPYGGSQGANYGSFTQEPFTQPPAAYQQPYNNQPPYSQPGQYASQPQFSPPQQYQPPQPFSQPGYQQPQIFPGGPPAQYGAGSPPGYNPYQPPVTHAPAHGSLPARPPGLPAAPGLPQRPSFSGPPGGSFQHQGPPLGQQNWSGNGWNGPDQNPVMSSAYPPHSQGYNGSFSANASTVDDLIASAGGAREPDDIDEIIRLATAGIKPPKKEAPAAIPAAITAIPQTQPAPASVPAPVPAPAPAPEALTTEASEKKSKKDKDKATKMIYSDNEVSPEEKMARMPRYAFVPDGKEETALVDAALPAAAGVVDQ